MLRFLTGVRDEIDQAVEYDEGRRFGLADDFLEALTKGFREIEDHPHRNPRVDVRGLTRDYHDYLLDRFPYQLIYRVGTDGIEVVAVAHTRRRPGYWKKRGR